MSAGTSVPSQPTAAHFLFSDANADTALRRVARPTAISVIIRKTPKTKKSAM